MIMHNTCSIDYFLVTCHLLYSKFNQYLSSESVCPFFILIEKISLNLTNNDWNQVIKSKILFILILLNLFKIRLDIIGYNIIRC